MNDKNDTFLFSEEVIDFVKIANEFCELAENTFPLSRHELLEKIQIILPQLYLQSLKLPQVESIFEEGNEKFVTEEEYEIIQKGFESKLGYLDDYLEIVEPDFSEADGPVVCKLSEDFADIFQDLKDFLTLFRIGNNEMMNDAIWETKLNFGTFWGQKLVNSLRVIHKILNADEPVIEDNKDSEAMPGTAERDTSSWFVTKRQEDFRDIPSIEGE